ncbi:hypothetical protein VTO42DRAFT_5843 [Malbranchea cinnamomea]
MKRVIGGGNNAVSLAIRRQGVTISGRYGCCCQLYPLQRRLESSYPSEKTPPCKRPGSAPSPSSEDISPSTIATTPPNSTSAGQSPQRSLKYIPFSSIIVRAAEAYTRAHDARPYWMQLWTMLVVYLCGDLTAQILLSEGVAREETSVEKAEKQNEGQEKRTSAGWLEAYDPFRTLRHLTVGAIAAVPAYKWFMFLHFNFNFSSRVLSIATKVVISQAVFTPVFNTYFFSAQSLLAGASLQETLDRVAHALPISLVNSVKFWPAVTAFQFAFIDPRFRSIFSGVLAIGWQSYLSWLNQRAAMEVSVGEQEQSAIASGPGETLQVMEIPAPRLSGA